MKTKVSYNEFRDYASNHTWKEVRSYFRITDVTIYRYIKRYNIKPRKGTTIYDVEYLKVHTPKESACYYCVSVNRIYNVLKQYQIKPKKITKGVLNG